MRRVFHRTSDPVQRARTAPPQQWPDTHPKLSPSAHQDRSARNSSERARGLSPPLVSKTVVVPITASMEFRGGADKRKQPQQPQQPGPPPLPTSPRPYLTTNPAIGSLQGGDDRRRPQSPPASPRNEGFRYPGSDLPRRTPSLRGQPPRRYGDDLPVFNNGIGGGPIQRYPIVEDDYFQPTSSSSSSRYSADAQPPPPKRPGRPERYS